MDLVSLVTIALAALGTLAFGHLGRLWAERAERRQRQKTQIQIAGIQAELKELNPSIADEASSFAPIVLSTSTAQAPSGYVHHETAIAQLRRQLFDISNKVEKQRSEIVEVQKIDPVLEATLKAGIENLTKRIEALEKNQLTKWDAATVVLKLLGGIGVIVGVVFAIIKYLSG